MINKIGFENIRVFKELEEFDLKPITILTGPNNAGKSTLQKMLMILKNGLEKKNGKLQLSKLEFKDDLLNTVGNIHNNITYGSINKELMLKFDFEDSLFEKTDANLVYQAEAKDGKLVRISFNSNSELLFSYELVKNEGVKNLNNGVLIYGSYWKLDENVFHNYISKLYDRISQHREIGRKQIVLKEIAFEIMHNDSVLGDFTDDKRNVYNFYKDRGIVAGCDEAINLLDLLVDRNVWCVYDFNTKNIYEENSTANIIYQKFKNTNNSNFLIDSILLKVIGEDFDFFMMDTQKKHEKLIKVLKENGVYNFESFSEKYKEFEKLIIANSCKKLLLPTEFFDDINNGLDIDTIFERNIRIPVEVNNINNPYLKDNIIIKIMYESGLMKKTKGVGRPISSDLLDGILKGDNLNIKKATEIIEFNFFMSPAKSLKTELLIFLNTIELSNQDSIKKYYMLDDANSKNSPFIKFGKRNDDKEKSFVNKWLLELGISEGIMVNEITIGSQVIGYYYSLLINKTEIPLADNGMGINQVILLLLKMVTSSSDTHFLLEEPEVNMHPALQSKLANLFTDAYNEFKTKFIVETHSEYLIRKLQYLTAKKSLGTEDTVIYYFNNDKNVSIEEPKIREIFINKYGGLSDAFGPGFYDEASNLKFELMKLNQVQSN